MMKVAAMPSPERPRMIKRTAKFGLNAASTVPLANQSVPAISNGLRP